MDYILARKQSEYLKHLCDAHDNIEAAKALDAVSEMQPNMAVIEAARVDRENAWAIYEAAMVAKDTITADTALENVKRYDAIIAAEMDKGKQDIAAQKLVYSNYVIGGSGDKAVLLGTVGAAPTATEKTLTDIGFTKDVALSILDESTKLRTNALALRVVEVKPVEEPIK